jgi:hypothetical protein
VTSYLYVCKNCKTAVESERQLTEHTRHIIGDGVVCGTLRRDWRAENVALARVPGGGRPHRS